MIDVIGMLVLDCRRAEIASRRANGRTGERERDRANNRPGQVSLLGMDRQYRSASGRGWQSGVLTWIVWWWWPMGSCSVLSMAEPAAVWYLIPSGAKQQLFSHQPTGLCVSLERMHKQRELHIERLNINDSSSR